ncbi:PH domain-containing protein [Pseudidiomarina salinarum]|uniref:PH domain-containing protein n=1 Tax=Pseudidiomarina salinarum TaxID=435908 RepID=UPI00068B4994|nr:PH domain-containing protein [Pseudidiomarina salinarum]
MAPEWKSVSKDYQTYLQLKGGFNMAILAVALSVFSIVENIGSWLPDWWILASGWLVLTLFLLLFWAPRRYRFTGYAETDEAMYLRRGALWRLQRGVPLNRIQHVEIKESLLERMLSLSHLVIYTAGSSGADLAIPGLKPDEAERIKSSLITEVANEPDADELSE